jgi:hypothetical protein
MRRSARSALLGMLGTCAAFVALVASPTRAAAQALWLDRTRPRAVMLELLKPKPSGIDGLTPWSGAAFVTGRFEFSLSLHGVGEVSIVYADFDDFPVDQFTGALLGGPYVGVEFGRTESVVLYEAGVRVPIDDSKFVSSLLGAGSDLERGSAWRDTGVLTMRLGLRVRSRPSDQHGLWAEGRLAPDVAIDLDPTEVFPGLVLEGKTFYFGATYGATARVTRSWVRGGIGVGGRAAFDTDDDFIDAAHEIEAAADFLDGAWRPGFSLRFPFDGNFGETFDRTIGLQLTYAF